ncbi:pyrophosphate fructose phosphotransferase (PFP) [Monocercomonoides exilis]|uniref:pyrophosphate fructose phosphotransferase (PFP) n=1 Tax=Monocercomonoides exilis TaxID=2049356 RepID=UPI0035597717|nr:pyrophosphate fructose phosphotransferase (PFP) [Monocercomonoides exilis]|eukprot:MONOS_6000.1-p1 / transcript=MONOS_6000.1 / gene=MONOS_6000 / organism=Monocercomonoides_exilis_PA203 / gene_product=pyrophosphate fructose phosphotransferase (PFP) / transcript_product=pyrophosphate fructose phosphotransferase (PFP) / location=Mono_scaffold00182:93764-95637(-) / protein_length=528 / sequence_SO=supercontig / SO=protein_coding / is_pseudo=false
MFDEKGKLTAADFAVATLGECRYETTRPKFEFVRDDERILLQQTFSDPREIDFSLGFEVAGQREKMFFKPEDTIVGIVTCGGLCPGLNDVIRALTYASLSYKVKKVLGFKYGYQGLSQDGLSCIPLDSRTVNDIHMYGGSFLGSSRGPIPIPEIVETLIEQNVNILFTIGGDGTQRGSEEIHKELKRRHLPIAVVGIPKTIDNDIMYISRTFGFDTSVEQARNAISCANAEAQSARHGIGLVKLMGRDSGFIAAQATLASGDVNICLIPEEPFTLSSLMESIRLRLLKRDHCVIVVAEGAGVDILRQHNAEKRDKSGNVSYGDIGLFLKKEITSYFDSIKMEVTIKYIDPSYTIRSTKPTAADAAFCEELGNKAVDSALSGKTGCIVGYWNDSFTLVPLSLIRRGRKKVDIHGGMWNTVKQMTWDLTMKEHSLPAMSPAMSSSSAAAAASASATQAASAASFSTPVVGNESSSSSSSSSTAPSTSTTVTSSSSSFALPPLVMKSSSNQPSQLSSIPSPSMKTALSYQ